MLNPLERNRGDSPYKIFRMSSFYSCQSRYLPIQMVFWFPRIDLSNLYAVWCIGWEELEQALAERVCIYSFLLSDFIFSADFEVLRRGVYFLPFGFWNSQIDIKKIMLVKYEDINQMNFYLSSKEDGGFWWTPVKWRRPFTFGAAILEYNERNLFFG